MFAKRFLGVGLLTSITALSMAAMTMTVDLKEGQAISGSYKFDVRVQSDSVVNSVEFYLGDDLRDTDESTPYQFGIDTLAEAEGKVKVTFAAYNGAGESVKKSFNIVIDNQLSKGLKFHVDRATELTRDGKYDDAVQAARIALKIDKNDNTARMAMARANYAMKVYDVAQKYAEDVVMSDPKNVDGKALLAAINLRRAFAASGGNAAETNRIIKDALVNAASAQRDILILEADAVKRPTSGSLVPYLDAQIKAMRYNVVATTLRADYEKNMDDPALTNRFLLALYNTGRFEEALKVINNIDRYGSPDAYYFSLKSLVLQALGNTAASESAEKEVILEDPSGALSKYTQAQLALMRRRITIVPGFVAELERSAPSSADVDYLKSAVAFMGTDFDRALTSVQNGLLSNPAHVALLVERGNQILESIFSQNLTGDALSDRATLAQAYFEAALAARPESFQALVAMTYSHMVNGQTEKAVGYARAAVAAAPEYGGAYYALAGALRQAQVDAQADISKRAVALTYRDQADAALLRAGQLDSRLKGQIAPNGKSIWQYSYYAGRTAILPMPPKE
ncbi:MAG: hypothetical protein KF836_01675 [Fimbriimonadaceae bacterium]|nr:hypothetical protein [Fimbriimonadaceae bacterium]